MGWTDEMQALPPTDTCLTQCVQQPQTLPVSHTATWTSESQSTRLMRWTRAGMGLGAWSGRPQQLPGEVTLEPRCDQESLSPSHHLHPESYLLYTSGFLSALYLST